MVEPGSNGEVMAGLPSASGSFCAAAAALLPSKDGVLARHSSFPVLTSITIEKPHSRLRSDRRLSMICCACQHMAESMVVVIEDPLMAGVMVDSARGILAVA